jgi:Flp pilus assembly protein TadB
VTGATCIVLAVASGWALTVATLTDGSLRRRHARRPAPRGPNAETEPAPLAATSHSHVARLGAAVRRFLASATGGTPRAGVSDRGAGWAVLSAVALLVLAPPLAPVPIAWIAIAPVLAARRERVSHEASLHDQLPDVVGLVALTTAAGLPVAASLMAIGARPGGPLGTAIARAAARLHAGASTAEALAAIAAAGPPVRPLVDALAHHDRYGTPLLPALDRVALEARARRRRRSEEAARRLPVTLLFPLVLTVFPAFVLLTVVPLLAGSLGSLSLTTP